jgi:16S rRNA processing protein RimM
MTTPDLLVVGHIRKAHGLKGEVVVRLTTNRAERISTGAVLVGGDQELFVASSRPKDDDYLVTFEGVSSREAADALRGTELFAPPLDDPDELWIHELIGANVIDQGDVVRGRVVEVLANPASDLLVLDNDALVPATFIIAFDPGSDGGVVRVDVPDGLFDL